MASEADVTSVSPRRPQGQNSAAASVYIVLPAERLTCNLDFGIPVLHSATADKAFVISSDDRTYTSSEYPRSTTCGIEQEALNSVFVEDEKRSMLRHRIKHSGKNETFRDVAPAGCKQHPAADSSITDTSHGEMILPEYIAKFIRARRKEIKDSQCINSGPEASTEHVQTSVRQTTQCENATISGSCTTNKHTRSTNTRNCDSERPDCITRLIGPTKQKEALPMHPSHAEGISEFGKPGGTLLPRQTCCHQEVVHEEDGTPRSLKTTTTNTVATSQNSTMAMPKSSAVNGDPSARSVKLSSGNSNKQNDTEMLKEENGNARNDSPRSEIVADKTDRASGVASPASTKNLDSSLVMSDNSGCHAVREQPCPRKRMTKMTKGATKTKTGPYLCAIAPNAREKDKEPGSIKDKKESNGTWRKMRRMECRNR